MPLARYGLAAGLTLAWMRAIGEFGATMVMAYHPHSLPVYLWVELSGRGLSAALPVALVALVMAALVLFLAQGLAMAGLRRAPSTGPVLRGPAHEPEAPRPEVFAATATADVAEKAPALELDLRYRCRPFELEVQLEAGREIVSLFGPSGAGKTTLLRLISGLLRPHAGWLRLDGRDLYGGTDELWVPPHDRAVGMVFQSHTLFPHLSVRENILFGVGADQTDRESRLRKLVGMTRLDGLESRYPHELSGGQQQRVALARALIRRPRVLLLDEPFSSLDSNMKERLLLDVRRIHETVGLSVIYVTHDLRDACSLADRLAVIDDGRILQVGDPLEVIRRPATHAVGRFVGMRNLFEGMVMRCGGGRVLLRAAGLDLEADAARELRPGQTVHFGIRPEDIVLLKPDRPLGPPADENVLRGRIVLERLRGPTYTLTFRVHDPDGGPGRLDLEIELPVRSYESLGIGDLKEWRVSIRRSALHVLDTD